MTQISETGSARTQPGVPLTARPLTRWLSRFRTGTLRLHLPDGRSLHFGGEIDGPAAEMTLHHPGRLVARVLHRGDIGFAESFMAGEWDTPALAPLIQVMASNEHAYNATPAGRWYTRLLLGALHRLRANTLRGSRRNIAYHYDLGNDFYRLWLDETMTYSSAPFAEPGQPLAEAQRHKYRHTLEQLGAQPGERLLEIGCGWGGFAREAARAGVAVTGLTLSREQLAWAQSTLAEEGLDAELDLRLQDYREVSGQFDHIVSIEMFEAVGQEHWPAFFDTIYRCLRPGGRALLQIITIDEASWPVYTGGPDFIQRYIFPGGMLPTEGRVRDGLGAAGLHCEQVTSHAEDYADTLLAWHENFLACSEQIRAQGFDERFRRMWRYYLGYCEGGFRCGRIDLQRFQVQRPHA